MAENLLRLREELQTYSLTEDFFEFIEKSVPEENIVALFQSLDVLTKEETIDLQSYEMVIQSTLKTFLAHFTSMSQKVDTETTTEQMGTLLSQL